MGRFPLYEGGTYRARSTASSPTPGATPTSSRTGPTTLLKEVGQLVGVPIPVVRRGDSTGFVSSLTSSAGWTVDNPRAINDPPYGG